MIVAHLPDCKNWYSFRTNCALDLRFFLGCLVVFFSFFPFLDFFGFVGFLGFLGACFFLVVPLRPGSEGTGREEAKATTCCGWSLLLVGFFFLSPSASCMFCCWMFLGVGGAPGIAGVVSVIVLLVPKTWGRWGLLVVGCWWLCNPLWVVSVFFRITVAVSNTDDRGEKWLQKLPNASPWELWSIRFVLSP